MFSDQFIERLPQDPLLALREICKQFLEVHSNTKRDEQLESYEDYLRALALVDTFVEEHSLKFGTQSPPLENSIQTDCYNIAGYIQKIYKDIKEQSASLTYEAQRSLLSIKIGRGHFFEFTEGDLKRIQTLINELRVLATSTPSLSADHRQRLLTKLERLQSELHKKVSDLDRFYGLVGDAGVLLGKLGKDAKPFVDRIRELAQIVWRTQSTREELPSGSPPPMLPGPASDDP
ncbi:MAG: hypothetical protein JWR16_2371 [Nevskia sp.]|nr:hypothetical protein [Nevskia sp.]